MSAPITPPAAKLQKWRSMRDNNNITEELEDMARWLLHELHKRARPSDAISAKCGNLLNIFMAIRVIHCAEGHIPVEVYAYRGISMRGFLQFAKDIDPELYRAFHGCL